MLHFISISRVFCYQPPSANWNCYALLYFQSSDMRSSLFRRFHLCVSRVSSPSVCFCPFFRPLGLSCLPIVSPTLRLSKCLNLCSLGRVRFLCFHRWRSFVEGAEKRKYALLWRSHFRREESRYFYLSDLYSLPLFLRVSLLLCAPSFEKKQVSSRLRLVANWERKRRKNVVEKHRRKQISAKMPWKCYKVGNSAPLRDSRTAKFKQMPIIRWKSESLTIIPFCQQSFVILP